MNWFFFAVQAAFAVGFAREGRYEWMVFAGLMAVWNAVELVQEYRR